MASRQREGAGGLRAVCEAEESGPLAGETSLGADGLTSGHTCWAHLPEHLNPCGEMVSVEGFCIENCESHILLAAHKVNLHTSLRYR